MPKLKNKPHESPPTAPGALLRLRHQLYRPRFLIAAAAIVGLCLGWPTIRSLIPELGSRPEYKLAATKIQVTQPPKWVPHNLVEQVIEHADLPSELSFLDDDLVRSLAEAFALHPWVAEVESVRKSFPPAIEVKLKYREPVAMVEVKNGKYPVDAQGVLLPPQDFSSADARGYQQIIGVHSTPQGPAGSNWGDEVVVEAARLAARLAPCWKRLKLAAIVCPREPRKTNDLDSGVYELITQGGSEIIWGHGPRSDHPGELTTDQKIERLETYAKKFGGLDPPQGRRRIDIRHRRDVIHSPLSTQRERPDENRR
ncbi:MAG: hypothetical protein EXS05_22830 [Planctomycetaceae bacterium]|nr:hypothetical protein [Planctomycetaceae bacterium]